MARPRAQHRPRRRADRFARSDAALLLSVFHALSLLNGTDVVCDAQVNMSTLIASLVCAVSQLHSAALGAIIASVFPTPHLDVD